MKPIGLLLPLLLQCVCVFAAPDSFRFQGRLTDSGGHPIVGTPTVIFKLYEEETGGAETWSSGEVVVTTNESGLFSTFIGPIPVSNESRYVEVSLRAVGGFKKLLPRQELGAVPYAFHSNRADVAAIAEHVPPNSISEDNLQQNSVGSEKIAPGSITAAHLAVGAISVGSEEIRDRSILEADYSIESITSEIIRDGSIRGADIVSASIESQHIAPGSITGSNVGVGEINGIHLSPNSITSSHVGDGEIDGADIRHGAIASNHIAPDSITFDKIKESDLAAHGYFPLPPGAIFMFLSECPEGYTEVKDMRRRYVSGADPERENDDIPDLPGEKFGAASHFHPHQHGNSTDIQGHFSQGETIGSDGRLNRFSIPKLIWEFTALSGSALSMTGWNHKHNIPLDETPAKALPPAMTVTFCQKD